MSTRLWFERQTKRRSIDAPAGRKFTECLVGALAKTLNFIGGRDILAGSMETSGVVLKEFVESSAPVGIAYYHGGDAFELTDRSSRNCLIFAQIHSLMQVEIGRRKPMELTAYTTLILPAGSFYRVKSLGSISHLAILSYQDKILRKTEKVYKLPDGGVFDLMSSPLLLTRTNWLNEAMHRYVFERIEARESSNEATAFLECELMKEVYYLAKNGSRYLKDIFDFSECSGLDRKDPILKRALAYIEKNLFKDISMDRLSEECFASESSVLRVFRKAYSRTPFDYIRDRRLDEAVALLNNGKYSIGEVATLIGYESDSAFIKAFKKRFNQTPMKWRGRGG